MKRLFICVSLAAMMGGNALAANWLWSEDFETYDPSRYSIPGYMSTWDGLNPQDSTNVIEGAYSLDANSGLNSAAAVYILNASAYHWDTNTTKDIYMFFLLKVGKAPNDGDSREIFWFADVSYHLGVIYLHNTAGSIFLEVQPFGGQWSRTAAGFTAGSTNAVWVRLKASTGANDGQMDAWFAPYYKPGDAIKPPDASAYHVTAANGILTSGVPWGQWGAIKTGYGIDVIWDHIRVDTNSIGNNPDLGVSGSISVTTHRAGNVFLK